MTLDSDFEKISRWPLVHPGETSILPDGTVLILDNIVIPHCDLEAGATQYAKFQKLEEAFRNTTRSWPVQQTKMILTNPVLVMVAKDGEWIGLDGKARVDHARKFDLPGLPTILLGEDHVREIGTLNFQHLLDGETTLMDKANYRAAQLASSVHATKIPTRPWMQDPLRQTELAFGAGSRDGSRRGRPYVHIKLGADIPRNGEAPGRKISLSVKKLETGIGKVLARLRALIHEQGHRISLHEMVDQLTAARLRNITMDGRTYPLVLGLPHIRDLETLVAKVPQQPATWTIRPRTLQIEKLDPRYDHPDVIQLIFLLRDLGAMRLRIQEYDLARNALIRDAQRGATIEQTNYERALFDDSNRSLFHPLPDYLGIPGLIDTMSVARETGMLASDYHAEYYFTRPMHEVAMLRGCYDRNEDPKLELSTAITYLQHRFQMQCDAPGLAAQWWELATGGDIQFANYLQFAALATVRHQSAMPLSAATVEIERAMAA